MCHGKITAPIRHKVLKIKLALDVKKLTHLFSTRIELSVIPVNRGRYVCYVGKRIGCHYVHTFGRSIETIGKVQHTTDGVGARHSGCSQFQIVLIGVTGSWVGRYSPG